MELDSDFDFDFDFDFDSYRFLSSSNESNSNFPPHFSSRFITNFSNPFNSREGNTINSKILNSPQSVLDSSKNPLLIFFLISLVVSNNPILLLGSKAFGLPLLVASLCDTTESFGSSNEYLICILVFVNDHDSS